MDTMNTMKGKKIELSAIGVNKEDNSEIYIINLYNGEKIYKRTNGKLELYNKSLKLEIVEQENCDNPRLVHYFRPIKISAFSLAMLTLGEKCVFYVPKGSVIK